MSTINAVKNKFLRRLADFVRSALKKFRDALKRLTYLVKRCILLMVVFATKNYGVSESGAKFATD